MNIGITTSFIIGGLLLLAMINLNIMVMQESSKTTFKLMSTEHTDVLREIISRDFSRMGFQPDDINDLKAPIESFNPPHQIVFHADVYGYGTKLVKWQFLENKPVNETSNPNDHTLQRNGPFGEESQSSAQRRFVVVDFRLTGYADAEGKVVTTNKDEIKSIQVEVVYESPEPIGTDSEGNPRYIRSTWKKLFVPSNMQFKKVVAK